MTDNPLRDRIEATVVAELKDQSRKLGWYFSHYEVYADNGDETGQFLAGMDGSFDVKAVADRLIAELGLRRDGCPCKSPGPNCRSRYVTDWKPAQ